MHSNYKESVGCQFMFHEMFRGEMFFRICTWVLCRFRCQAPVYSCRREDRKKFIVVFISCVGLN